VQLPLVGAFKSKTPWLRPVRRSRPAAMLRPSLPRLRDWSAPRGGSSWSAAKSGAPIFVDYAHKPDALAKALDALRPYVSGKLVVVFALAATATPQAAPDGAIAAAKADRVIAG